MAHLYHCAGFIVLFTWTCYLCIAINITHMTVNQFDKVNLKCTIGVNLSDDKLRWRHNGVLIYAGTQKIRFENLAYLERDYSLSLPNVSLSDEGNYSCSPSIYNSDGFIYQLTVKVLARLELLVDNSKTLKDVSVEEGHNITITCKATESRTRVTLAIAVNNVTFRLSDLLTASYFTNATQTFGTIVKMSYEPQSLTGIITCICHGDSCPEKQQIQRRFYVYGDDDSGTESSLESVTLKEAEDHSRIDSSLRGVLLITSSAIGVLIAALILLHCVKDLPRGRQNSFRLQHNENTDTGAAITLDNFDNYDQDRVHNDQDSSSFTKTDSRKINHGLYSSRIFKNGEDEATTEDGVLKNFNRSLPEIPKYICDNNDKCENYYDIREGHIRNRMFQLNDVCILTKLKFGDLYKRWTGTITIDGNSSQCVVITTTSDNVNKRREQFNWDLFVQRLLELPTDADSLVTTEGIYMDGGEIYILQQHLPCQTLQTLMDDKSEGRKVFISRASTYIMGILKGMELLHSYGLLHPGLSRRKILVMRTGNCKLYDFCLSQDASFVVRTRKEKLDECQLPEESIERYEYTTESDVWSVAVVVWEILTNDLPLIFLLDDNPSATNVVQERYSPDLPEGIIESRKVLLKECLLTEMERRPSIIELRKSFEEMLPENDLQYS